MSHLFRQHRPQNIYFHMIVGSEHPCRTGERYIKERIFGEFPHPKLRTTQKIPKYDIHGDAKHNQYDQYPGE